jgi:hypothetical protein
MKYNKWTKNGTDLRWASQNCIRGMWLKIRKNPQGNTLVDRQNKRSYKEEK